jgi:glyoxylase-like metal-dependent hydrolase (beta-lactamase superfamily II)
MRSYTVVRRTMLLLAMAVLPVRGQRAPQYEVFAVQYATIPSFRLASLIAGVDTSRRLDIAMMVWVVRGGGRTVLVDAGFHRDQQLQRWKPRDFVTPAAAVQRLGIAPDAVTDVIISHAHWDHMGSIDLFRNAKIWIQREEYAFYTGDSLQARRAGADLEDVKELVARNGRGQVSLVDGDAKEILSGITVYTGGRHTVASQYVGVKTAEGTVVLASDNMYLFENLANRRPIAQTLDSLSNLAAQDRMKTLASSERLIVPGHDPEVFRRFPAVMPGVVRIK